MLRKLSKSIQVYRDLRADGHIGGCIRRRKAAVKSLEFGVDRDQAKSRIASQDASYDNPYGQPDLARCFWPTRFKQGGMDFWFKFVEKYGMPWLVGKSPRSSNDAENERLLDMLDAVVQDAVAVIADDASVEIVEAGGKSASADVFKEFLIHLRAEALIAKATRPTCNRPIWPGAISR